MTTTATKALVITADNSVTTWDCVNNNGSKPFVFYPNGDIPISDAAWNHNGQVLATCSALSTEEQIHNNIVLTAAQTGSRLDSLQHDEKWNQHRKVPAGAINSLAFGGKSRYLCVGDESGAVCLWDLKKRLRVRQFFHDNHPSRQVSLDPTDTYILSLSPRLFSCYKLREGTLLGTVSPPHGPAGNNSLYTRYNISTIETNQTAIGTTDGTIHIYDIANLASSSSSHSTTMTMTKPLLSFGQRNSYISEVAFSPNNSKLLLACDQDGIVTLYDKNSGEWLQNIDALNHSIMAMHMHVDGYSLAVGTETGQVLIYDIRHQTTSPIASMYVQGPVTSLQFAPPPKPSSSSSGGAGRTSQQQQPQQIHALTPQSSIDEKENNESSGTVIKQSHQSAYTAPPPPYSNTRPVVGDQQPKSGTTSNKATSPPKQQQKQHQPQSSSTSSNNKPKMHVPTLGEIQSARNNLNSSPLSSTLMQQQQNHPEGGGGGYHHHQGRSTQQQQQQAQQSSASTSNNKPPLHRGQEQPSRLDGNKNINQSSQQPGNNNLIGQQQQRNNLPPVNSSGSNNFNMQLSSEAATINMEEIRDLVRDEVENLKDDVEEAIRNLHMDMIAQFHQQSQELKNIVQVQMATIGKLSEENEILRERLGISRGEEEEDPGEGNARG